MSAGASKIQRIAVIGAGAAGLCAARSITKNKQFEAVVYETTDHVGGTWFYTEATDKDENGYAIHSSMYKDLTTNLPKQVMAFPDLPFDESLPSFLTHMDVLQYLKSYCDVFDLRKHIKFNTNVNEIKLLPSKELHKFPSWEVKSFDCKRKSHNSDIFDGVMVCNGHYSVPSIPDIEGLGKFKGEILHSHCYRTKEVFENKRIVLFGAAASGTDIALNLSNVAQRVILSHKGSRFLSPLPGNVQEEFAISSITENGVVFEDGKMEECDAIMFCTGYNYNFPFLNSSILKVEKNRVTPLHKHLIHILYPNLSFIGLCQQICPFPQFHCQIMYAMGVLDGSVKLPSAEEMLKLENDDYQQRVEEGLPKRGAHVLSRNQWAYNDELADISGKQRISDSVRLLYDLCHERRVFNVQNYKTDEFSLGLSGHYYRLKQEEAIP